MSSEIYNVFISSTFRDNDERRKIVRDAIERAGMRWHGIELFTAATRPTVDECLRLVKEADILVGIIAWRYGWIPDGYDKSITALEYDAAKERLIFLIDPKIPVNPEIDFDSDPSYYAKVTEFKKRASNDQKPVYFTETSLSGIVLYSLNLWRKQHEQPPDKKSANPKRIPSTAQTAFDKTIQRYREKAEAVHGTLPVAGFAIQLKMPINIEELFIPLQAMVNLRSTDDEPFADATDAESRLKSHGSGLELPLLEAFGEAEKRGRRGVLILGDPGAGKTTYMKRLLLWCFHNGSASLGLPEDVLPVFLPLRELRNLKKGLDSFIREQLNSPNFRTQSNFGAKLLERGRLLLLLDGLDEVADADQRQQVGGWIADALSCHPSCYFAVTCRFAGYSPTLGLGGKLLEMHISPFDAGQADAFIRNWYRIVETGLAQDSEIAEGIALERADQLIERLKESDFRARRVFELTRNPLLLANICLVHRHRGDLPNKRTKLYEECIDVLLEHWQKGKGLQFGISADTGRRSLQPAALWLHGEDGRTRASAKELAPHIKPVLKALNIANQNTEHFLRTIRDQSGLLTGWGHDSYGFMHLGFQEYLAAREIRNRSFDDPTVLVELAKHFGESWWQEVILLLLGLEEPSRFVPFMREVVKLPVFAEYPDFAEMCLDDAAEVAVEPFLELVKGEISDDPESLKGPLLALRFIARLDVGIIEDLATKFKQHSLPDIENWFDDRVARPNRDIITARFGGYRLAKIPGGDFIMGSPDNEKGRWDAEGPVHKVTIKDFYLGQYPVTNEEYGRYMQEHPDVPEPRFWGDRRYNQPRQPVVGVTWNDAQAYAKGGGLRLPSEAEWEYACRASTTTRFHTGDKDEDLDRAGWYGGNSGSKLHPVGEKEANEFGLFDMHGNVWEWVEDDWHGSYGSAPNDGKSWIDKERGALRVIRGGGWGNGADGCRSAYRNCSSPGNRDYDLGFRLARSV